VAKEGARAAGEAQPPPILPPIAGTVDVLCTHQEKIKAAPIEAESSNKEHHD